MGCNCITRRCLAFLLALPNPDVHRIHLRYSGAYKMNLSSILDPADLQRALRDSCNKLKGLSIDGLEVDASVASALIFAHALRAVNVSVREILHAIVSRGRHSNPISLNVGVSCDDTKSLKWFLHQKSALQQVTLSIPSCFLGTLSLPTAQVALQ